MNRPLGATTLALLIAAVLPRFASPAPAQDDDTGPHVRVTVTAHRDTLAPGASSELRVSFRPSRGFHVNAVPPVSVGFDSGSNARPDGKIVIPADTATGYLDPASPVRQPFSLASSARRGRATLEGTLTYFYCSDEEGWCRRERLRFAVPVSVR